MHQSPRHSAKETFYFKGERKCLQEFTERLPGRYQRQVGWVSTLTAGNLRIRDFTLALVAGSGDLVHLNTVCKAKHVIRMGVLNAACWCVPAYVRLS